MPKHYWIVEDFVNWVWVAASAHHTRQQAREAQADLLALHPNAWTRIVKFIRAE